MKKATVQYLVMYDITDEKTLQRVAKLFERTGFERMNYSVWLGWENPGKANELNKKLKALLGNEDAKNSKLYFIPITQNTLKKMRSITGRRPAELDYWLMERPIMFF